MNGTDTKLTRIGIFFDGSYFQVASDYYCYHHERRARLSIQGVQRFAVREVAKNEQVEERYCQVVDAHYFRGRFTAIEAAGRGKLEGERSFEDALMRANVVTHYLPRDARGSEKGIDVWLALEAFELAIYKRFNVLVLVACDGDYLPLIRKLSTIGTRVLLLAWDFRFTDQVGKIKETRTAQTLIDAVTYPIMMHQVIDDRATRNDPIISGLFLPRRTFTRDASPRVSALEDDQGGLGPQDNGVSGPRLGRISRIMRDRSYGFLEEEGDDPDSWFFPKDEVRDNRFYDLLVGDEVSFILGPNPRKPGMMMAKDVTLLREANSSSSSVTP